MLYKLYITLLTVVFIATAAAIYSLEHRLCTFTAVLRLTQPSWDGKMSQQCQRALKLFATLLCFHCCLYYLTYLLIILSDTRKCTCSKQV